MLENARWIKSSQNVEEACYNFYKDIILDKKIKKAILSITSMGLYVAYIDGKRVGNELFAPYWTAYQKRLQYQTYDVTDMVSNKSLLSIVCAEGWAVGNIRVGSKPRNHYADNIALLFSLDITYEDGSMCSIVSDDSVKVATSHILSSSIYNGETVDKTADIIELGNALIDKTINTTLVHQEGERVVEQESISPVKYIVTPKGEKVIDFGQNFAGYVRVTVNGKKGDIIRISHAEILDNDGNFYTENLRTAKQQNTYILSGDGEETFNPTFSWQGFRYIRLDEFPFDEVDLDCFEGVVVYSDIKRTGDFSCSNLKLNQLYHNIIWGQKSNFIDVPTDCPQRDERLGWTGDAQVFVRTAAINFDVEKFFSKWLADVAAEQTADGAVGMIVPSVNIDPIHFVRTGWGDACTVCPWEIYLAYGNKEILEKQFESMTKWVDYIRGIGEEEFLWLGGHQFGDWLALDKPNADPEDRYGATSTDYIASAYFAYSTSLVIRAGKALNYDVTKYEELYKNIVKAFQNKFMLDGIPFQKTQTAYAIALYFNLAVDTKKTVEGLAQLIKDNGNKLTTGFLGTPYLLHSLSENGFLDVAYDLLLQEEYPSWLYTVNHGATTMWEHWDGIREDGTFWSSTMNSYNHYAYGAVYDWIFGVAAGIKVLDDGAGYKHISIKPMPDKRLEFMNAGIKTKYGRIGSYWYYNDNGLHFEFDIPKDVVAEITLPDGKNKTVCGKNYMYTIKN